MIGGLPSDGFGCCFKGKLLSFVLVGVDDECADSELTVRFTSKTNVQDLPLVCLSTDFGRLSPLLRDSPRCTPLAELLDSSTINLYSCLLVYERSLVEVLDKMI